MYADKESELLDYDKALDILANYTDKKGSVSLQRGNIYVNKDCPFYDMEDAKENYENAVLKGNAFAAYQLRKEAYLKVLNIWKKLRKVMWYRRS